MGAVATAMNITEAGRAFVQTDEFLMEYARSLKSFCNNGTSTEAAQSSMMLWLAATALCGLPADYEPAPDEFHTFAAANMEEVRAVVDGILARFTARAGRLN